MSRRATPRSRSTEALADALHSAAIRLLRRLRRVDDETGLSPARLSALSVIVFGGPLRITDLARAEQVRTPTITPIVASLEGAGLVTREVDQGDGRASVLRATAAGRDVMARGRARRVEALTAELRRLPAADRDILRRAADLMQRVARGASG
jgi:DNA-binding MarR family transcriptional regulator